MRSKEVFVAAIALLILSGCVSALLPKMHLEGVDYPMTSEGMRDYELARNGWILSRIPPSDKPLNAVALIVLPSRDWVYKEHYKMMLKQGHSMKVKGEMHDKIMQSICDTLERQYDFKAELFRRRAVFRDVAIVKSDQPEEHFAPGYDVSIYLCNESMKSAQDDEPQGLWPPELSQRRGNLTMREHTSWFSSKPGEKERQLQEEVEIYVKWLEYVEELVSQRTAGKKEG
jgi:hypothetical protein